MKFLFYFTEGKGKHPDSKVHGADMEPIGGRQDPGGPHVDPMNFAIWVGNAVVMALPFPK